MQNPISVIGLMSGTSLDGLDIAHCTFWKEAGQWQFSINQTTTIGYPSAWENRLKTCMQSSALELAFTDVELGHWMGRQVAGFMKEHALTAHFVSSHGHTVFHQPSRLLTLQIGKGSAIAAETGLPVVNDFRAADVALGGQGAPLVPIGDELLFSGYDVCLNLGGFANLSAHFQGKRIAFDVGPCNLVLNSLAMRSGNAYDQGGTMARSGKLIPQVLESLNRLSYYQQPFPKSLGKEWADAEVFPLLPERFASEDLLHTMVVHIAMQLSAAIAPLVQGKSNANVLVTGGGAFNTFLLEQCRQQFSAVRFEVPSEKLVSFKEALVFAFLGLLRWKEENNCLRSVTGARHDHSGGSIWKP